MMMPFGPLRRERSRGSRIRRWLPWHTPTSPVTWVPSTASLAAKRKRHDKRMRERLEQVKAEVRTLHLKQSHMRPEGQRLLQQQRGILEARNTQLDGDKGYFEANHDHHNGRRIGEAAHPGPPPRWRPLLLCLSLVISWSTQPLNIFDHTGLEGDGPTPTTDALAKARPALRLASANVTSLAAVWELIPDLQFDLLALQTTHL